MCYSLILRDGWHIRSMVYRMYVYACILYQSNHNELLLFVTQVPVRTYTILKFDLWPGSFHVQKVQIEDDNHEWCSNLDCLYCQCLVYISILHINYVAISEQFAFRACIKLKTRDMHMLVFSSLSFIFHTDTNWNVRSGVRRTLKMPNYRITPTRNNRIIELKDIVLWRAIIIIYYHLWDKRHCGLNDAYCDPENLLTPG